MHAGAAKLEKKLEMIPNSWEIANMSTVSEK